MTREEAIKVLRTESVEIGGNAVSVCRFWEALDMAVKALEDVTDKNVGKVRHGRWIIKHKHRGGFRRYTGIDDMGEQHTITVDERVEYDDRYCSECGKQSADNFLTYCPNCGAKMDLEG